MSPGGRSASRLPARLAAAGLAAAGLAVPGLLMLAAFPVPRAVAAPPPRSLARPLVPGPIPGAERLPDAAGEQLRQMDRDRAARMAAARDQAARAEALRAQGSRLGAARVAAVARLRAADAATAEAADRVAALAVRRQAAEATLRARAADLQPMLPLIERLSLFPAETLLAVPAPPEQALTGLLVLRGLASELQSQARALRDEQAAVTALAAQEGAEVARLAAARAEQAAQGATLDRELAAARGAEQDAEDASASATRAAAGDAARADSLRGLLAAIEAQRRAAEAREAAAREAAAQEAAQEAAVRAQAARAAAAQAGRQRQDAAREAARRPPLAVAAPAPVSGPGLGGAAGPMTAPVAGTLVRGWGAATEAGPASGVSLQAGPGARVVSPCAGRVMFAQPFRSYGRLAIVDCGGGWHVVLAGLERLDVGAGHAVAAGEPIGVMPDWNPLVPGAGRPTLYVELRRGGQAVDPAPFLGGRS